MSRCLLVLMPGPFAVNTSWDFHTRAFAKYGTFLPMLSEDPEGDCELPLPCSEMGVFQRAAAAEMRLLARRGSCMFNE